MSVIPLNCYRPHTSELEAFSRAVAVVLTSRRASAGTTVSVDAAGAIEAACIESRIAIGDAMRRHGLSMVMYDRILGTVKVNESIRSHVKSRVAQLMSDAPSAPVRQVPEASGTAAKAGARPVTVLVGRETLVIDGLASLLATAGFDIAASVSNEVFVDPGIEANIVILAATGNRGWDGAAIARLIEENPKAAVILFGSPMDCGAVLELLAIGIRGYLSKSLSPQALLLSVRLIALGEIVYPSAFAECVCAGSKSATRLSAATAKANALGAEERRILEALVEGCPNKEIAERLGLAEQTVKATIKKILRKLGFQNRTQAAVWTAQNAALAPRERA